MEGAVEPGSQIQQESSRSDISQLTKSFSTVQTE